MAETVFILGAGASHEAGAPVMKDFLKRAEEVVEARDLSIVMNGVKKFNRTHSNIPVRPDNLEDIFAVFEMAKVLGYFPGLKPEEVKDLVPAMSAVIGKTLDETMNYTLVEHAKGGWYPYAPDVYANFVSLVQDIRGKAPHKHDVAVITFNYDVALDWAFADHSYSDSTQCISYALGEPSRGGIPLLKLHGSLNWAKFKDEEGEKVVPWEINSYLHARVARSPWDPRSEAEKSVKIHMSEHIKQHPFSDAAPIVAPFIIPPTWNKSGHYGEISSVWAAAARALSDAKNIFVIGYSMPETDIFFKHLMALGTADTRLERFWVCDPEPGANVKITRPELFGPGITDKEYRFVEKKFGEAIEEIRRELVKPA